MTTHQTTRKRYVRHILLLTSLITFFIFSCKKETTNSLNEEIATSSRFDNNGEGRGNVSPEMVLRWNQAASYVVLNTPRTPPNPPIFPFAESRYYAMVNIAMHDALNNIVPKYQSYTLNERDKDADPDAAVAQAAFDVITYFYGKLNLPIYPSQAVKDYINDLLVQSLAGIENGEAKTKGIALGHSAAQAIIQNRNNDGVANILTPAVVSGTLPGEYRLTLPFYAAPGWGNVKTFGLPSSTYFTVPPPYSINSSEYTEDYNEVKSLGRFNSATRTADQTDIARFWVENTPFGWNKIAYETMEQKNLDAWKTARLLALLQISEADAYIACLKAKIIHYFWRPVTAIREGDNDGNPNTTGDAAWEVLVAPTPPIADHPSGHATAGGAAAELLKQFFEKDDFSFTFESTTLPGKTRSFNSLSQAARENSLSRIYVGYHFRKAAMDGEALGKSIGDWIATHTLPEN